MPRTFFLSVLSLSTLSLAFGAGCGSQVSVGQNTGGGSSASMSSTTSTSSTGATTSSSSSGSGGSSSTSTTGSTSTSTSGGGPCADSYLDLVLDNGAPVHLTSSCFGSHAASQGPTAAAWRFEGGAAPGADDLNLDACSTGAQGSLGVSLVMPNANMVGMYMGSGGLSLVDDQGVTWGAPGDGWQGKITAYANTGAYIDGSFSGNATHGGNAAHSIEAQFHLCHINDILAP